MKKFFITNSLNSFSLDSTVQHFDFRDVEKKTNFFSYYFPSFFSFFKLPEHKTCFSSLSQHDLKYTRPYLTTIHKHSFFITLPYDLLFFYLCIFQLIRHLATLFPSAVMCVTLLPYMYIWTLLPPGLDSMLQLLLFLIVYSPFVLCLY